jgi:Ca2+-binding RTX toxin-like protein
MIGGAGNDTFHVDAAGDVAQESTAGGTDLVYASATYAMTGGAEIEVLSTIVQAATTAINLTGNGVGQTIYGNAGVNVLDGGAGNDVLIGLGGADAFAFTTALGAGNVDTISDYSVADDTIQLENAVFTGLAEGMLAAGAFNTGAAASDADDRIIYNSATGALSFDTDGNGAGAAVQFATLAGGLTLTASEFLVI